MPNVKILSRTILLAVTAVFSNIASATTYYVDSAYGKDTNDGHSQSPSASGGPWRSLTHVSSRILAPGDVIRLKCGNVWHESLTISSSGTLEKPITVSSYPVDCANPPVLDGSTPVPEASWKTYKENIYSAKTPLEYIPNGTFSSGPTGWRSYSSKGDERITTASEGCPPSSGNCIHFFSGSSSRNGILSSARIILEPKEHSLSFFLKAAPGAKIWVVLRRDGSPWDPLGLDQVITTTGAWQQFSINFKGKADISNARLDFEVPPNSTIQLDNVSIKAAIGAAHQLIVEGKQMRIARHPNPGHNANRPNSPYFTLAENSDRLSNENGKPGSSYIAVGSDFQIPVGASIVNTNIRIRTNAWMMDDRKATSISGTKILLDKLTSYPLSKGWGYFLYDALWMVDTPREWHHDVQNNTLYIWMPDGLHPANRVRIAHLGTAVNLENLSNITIENLEIKHFKTAINAKSAQNVIVSKNIIHDTTIDAIDGSSSNNVSILGNSITRTGRDAISGFDPITGRFATGMQVIENDLYDTGVVAEDNIPSSAPTRSYAAIRPGTNSRVIGNRVIRSGYHGIWLMANSEATSNHIESPCMVLDDCGGIYIRTRNSQSLVENNLIQNVIGAIEGKPFNYSQGQGIFLDDHTSDVEVYENKIIDAENGIQLHNATQNLLRGNLLIESRKSQIWLQATTKTISTEGDVFNNRIELNSIIPLSTSTGVHFETIFTSTRDFASLSGNQYYSMINPMVARETIGGISSDFSLAEWQTHEENGMARNLDSESVSTSPGATALFRVSSENLIKNGEMSEGLTSWEHWNSVAPYGDLRLDSGLHDQCLAYTAGASLGLVSSSRFSVQKDAMYRISFDLRAGSENQPTLVGVRRGGGGTNGFEWLMPAPVIYASTSWKRHAITFTASKTINAGDPITGDSGARIDFQVATPGQKIWIDNIEIVKLSPVGTETHSTALSNPLRNPIALDCPETTEAALYCDRYSTFPDGAPVIWPVTLEQADAFFIYSRGDTLIDSDSDGIGDIQDNCSDSRPNEVVNSKGCGLK